MNSQPSLTDRLLRAYMRTGWRGFISLWRLIGRDSNGTLRAKTSMGPVFELSPFAYIDSIVLREGFYETEVIRAIASVLGDGVLWDIGANFGLHGLTAKYQFPGARVICFEPSSEMVSRIMRNRELNRLEVDIMGMALSNKSGFQTLHLGPVGNRGMSTLSPWSAATYAGTSQVATERGDDLVERRVVPPPTVIKLDVEGHELSVLEGLASTLLLPTLHAVIYEDSGDSETSIKSLLKRAGFDSRRLDRLESTQHGLENFIASRPTSTGTRA